MAGADSRFAAGPATPSAGRGGALAKAGCAMVLGAISIADAVAHYEIAIGALYAVLILAMSYWLPRRSLIGLAMVCASLTLLSLLLSSLLGSGGDDVYGVVNAGISLITIFLTLYLLLAIDAARTAVNRSREKLAQFSRSRGMQGLTTAVAHEVSQPLAAILTNAAACTRWLQQSPPQLARAGLAADRIMADAARAGEIIGRVRSLIRGDLPQLSSFDLNAAVAELVMTLGGEFEQRGIAMLLELRASIPLVRADRVQIQQVLSNLLLNAAEALAAVPGPQRRIRVVTEPCEAGICCTVADSGPGIVAEIRPHLFEPFWTSKAEGIGVGLSLSRAIMEACGGALWFEEGEAGGAVFHFRVPLAEDRDGERGTS
ncbi:MAG: two-component sensor histidine kinase [Gammaproteobacteria bacterium]|nr:two-component sensor histidine kinase [Gammaproteobacteria bacterium]